MCSRNMMFKEPFVNEVNNKNDAMRVVKLQTPDDFCRHVNAQQFKSTHEEDNQQIDGIKECHRFTQLKLISML